MRKGGKMQRRKRIEEGKDDGGALFTGVFAQYARLGKVCWS
jgi:hypothetical protein